MRRIAVLIIAAVTLIAAGCETRTKQYSFSKSNVSQLQVANDAQSLKGTSGVKDVIYEVDSLGNGRLQVFVDETNDNPGVRRAIEELGYKIISP
jgi:hypothetical protein